MTKQTTRTKDSAFAQLLKPVSRPDFEALARRHDAGAKARSFSPWSHFAAMTFAQFSRATSLNDVADAMTARAPAFSAMGVTPASRNGLSHANAGRDADFAEALFWDLLGRLTRLDPGFAGGRRAKGLLRRFKVRIHAVDSTTISLVAKCMDWAAHRARKAAAKLHLGLDMHSFLPTVAVVSPASEHDSRRARELCAAVRTGEIVVFDKGYADFAHFADLDARGVFWVTRPKGSAVYTVKKVLDKNKGNIVADRIIRLKGRHAGMTLRSVIARVELDGVEREMEFITNNLAWAASSVCDLYRRRWDIEVFFKQVKQTLKLGSFLGTSLNAVRWQIWTALIAYVLVRFQAWTSRWTDSFARAFHLVRAVLLERLSLAALFAVASGTASERRRGSRPETTQLTLRLRFRHP